MIQPDIMNIYLYSNDQLLDYYNRNKQAMRHWRREWVKSVEQFVWYDYHRYEDRLNTTTTMYLHHSGWVKILKSALQHRGVRVK